MTLVAVVISDRPRDLYLNDCLDNLFTYLVADYEVHVVDDTAHELGMAGAVKDGWEWAIRQDCDYLLHIEEDFRLIDLPLRAMRYVLDMNPHLAQVVLKRQPWSNEEIAAGGQIEYSTSLGNIYTQRHGATGVDWVEHSTLFSVNPCLIPRRTLDLEWSSSHPGGVERAITEACETAGMRFAYYGHRTDPPRCEHVGHVRASTGWRW
jgi:hypothetical protein